MEEEEEKRGGVVLEGAGALTQVSVFFLLLLQLSETPTQHQEPRPGSPLCLIRSEPVGVTQTHLRTSVLSP